MAKEAGPQIALDRQSFKINVERCPTCGGIVGRKKHRHDGGADQIAEDAALNPAPYVYGETHRIAR